MEGGVPKAIEAERALLGGLIRDPARVAEVAQRVEAEDFHAPHHAALYKLIVRMAAQDRGIDLVTLLDQVARQGRQDQYGGTDYLLTLPDFAPSTVNLVHYADVVREKGLLRRLIGLSEEMREQAFAEPDDLTQLVADFSRRLAGLESGARQASWHPVSRVIDEEIQRYDEIRARGGGLPGRQSGFEALDRQLAGLNPTDLIILAARPGMGKTALALNLALNVALIEQLVVGVFSLEMGRGQLASRLLCSHAEVSASRFRKGELEAAELERLHAAASVLRGTPLHIDETPGLALSELQLRARQLRQERGPIGLLVVDYLQLMRGDDPRAPREQQISSISRGLKGLAKELACPVLALSQLNRSVESRADKRPLLSDLRESGAIEQDADVILFIYREEYYDKTSQDQGVAEVIVAKQRGGATGAVKLAFLAQYTKFENLRGYLGVEVPT